MKSPYVKSFTLESIKQTVLKDKQEIEKRAEGYEESGDTEMYSICMGKSFAFQEVLDLYEISTRRADEPEDL